CSSDLTPTVALDASSDPTTCGGNDGSITLLFTNVPAGNHTISYVDGANNAQAFNNVAVNLAGEATIANLSAGTYNDIAITVNGCTSTEDVDVTLSDPATPTVALDASSDPTTCGGNDGSITLLFTNVPAGNHTISYVDGANHAQAFNNVAVNLA